MFFVEKIVVLVVLALIIVGPVWFTVYLTKVRPRLRYFPSALTAAGGSFFAWLLATAPPSSGGGDWARAADSSKYFAMIVLAVFLLAAAIIFVTAFITHKNRPKPPKIPSES